MHGVLNHFSDQGLRLLEVERDALGDLPEISERLGALPYRFLLFCDDLSFEGGELGYKALKSALEGTVFAGAGNVMLVATSNRRHLMPERAAENQQFTHTDTGEVHPGETTEEKLSLADRFGLWVSFHPMAQPAYLEAAARWVAHYGAPHGVTFTDAAGPPPDLGPHPGGAQRSGGPSFCPPLGRAGGPLCAPNAGLADPRDFYPMRCLTTVGDR